MDEVLHFLFLRAEKTQNCFPDFQFRNSERVTQCHCVTMSEMKQTGAAAVLRQDRTHAGRWSKNMRVLSVMRPAVARGRKNKTAVLNTHRAHCAHVDAR